VRSQDADARDKCLTAYGEGHQVFMTPCAGGDDHEGYWRQQWYPVATGAGGTGPWYQYRNHYYGTQCLDVRNAGRSTVVQTWSCGSLSSAGHQKWKFW
jgi:hypothetical protein